MKSLTDWFSRVYVINCAHRPDRRARVLAELRRSGMADPARVIVQPAVIGEWTTVPDDWKAGPGAWGCLRSHQRILEDVLHERDDRNVLRLQSVLVLEDDVFFLDDAPALLDAFMRAVPGDWGQLYLGGQHNQPPEPTGIPGVDRGRSVNRTHAYALHARCYQAFYRHISYATDYRGTQKHIDHQLELAHTRRDWPVYCPANGRWLCGQEAGPSDISGQHNPRLTWLPA